MPFLNRHPLWLLYSDFKSSRDYRPQPSITVGLNQPAQVCLRLIYTSDTSVEGGSAITAKEI